MVNKNYLSTRSKQEGWVSWAPSRLVAKLNENHFYSQQLGGGAREGEPKVPTRATVMKILVCGNYGATNIGDDAILQGIFNLIAKHSPNAEVKVLSHHPTGENELPRLPFGIRSFFGKDWHKTLKAIKECDLFILGGGGLFVDTNKKAPLIWGWHAWMAHRYKKPIYLFANSMGPLNSFLGRFIGRKVLKWSKIVSFRDQKSLKLAQRLLPDKNYKLTPDPAFAIESENESESTGGGKIIISVRIWTKNVNNNLRNLPKIIDQIARANRSEILLMPFQSKGEEDLIILNKILEQCEAKEQVSLFKGPYKFKDTIAEFQGAKLVIGMRLHSMIFGTLTSTPIIAINYSDKVRNYMEDLGLEDYVLNPENIDKLPELVRLALSKSDEISSHLKKQTEERRKLLYSSSLKLAL